MRFDHHPPPTRVHPGRAVCYVAPSRGRRRQKIDPLDTCVREGFASTGTIDLSTDEPWFVLWEPTRELRLLDVVDSPWIARAGGNAAISSGARGMARQWARRAYAEYADIDGLYYEASTLPANRSVELFERAQHTLPAAHQFNAPLNHPGLRPAVNRIAHRYGMYLVL